MVRDLMKAAILTVSVVAAHSTALAQDTACDGLTKTFETALSTKNFKSAIAAEQEFYTRCGGDRVRALQSRRAALQIATAEALQAMPARAREYEDLVESAAKPEVYWYASYTLGEMRLKQKRYGEAAIAYQTAVEIVENKKLTPQSPSADAIKELARVEMQAKQLAANEINRPKTEGARYIPAKRDISGRMMGAMSRKIRGVTITKIPMPINFALDSAELTDIGRQAAFEFAKAIQEQNLSQITLTGHTDEQGPPDYNMTLSQRRLDTVVGFLKQNGVTAQIVAIPKGLTEPAQINDRQQRLMADRQEVYALDRRVEWSAQ